MDNVFKDIHLKSGQNLKKFRSYILFYILLEILSRIKHVFDLMFKDPIINRAAALHLNPRVLRNYISVLFRTNDRRISFRRFAKKRNYPSNGYSNARL